MKGYTKPDNNEGITDGKKISSYELQELDLLGQARALQIMSADVELIGKGLSSIPQFDIKEQPIGVGCSISFGSV